MDSENIHFPQSIDQAEEALRESETRFRLLFELAPYPVFLMQDYRFTDCNDAALKILDCSDKEVLLGLRPSQISPEIQPDGARSAEKETILWRQAANAGPTRFEWVFQAFSGTNFWMDVSLTTIPFGNRPTIHMAWHDITDKKLAEEALQVEKESLLTILDNDPIGVILSDHDGSYLYVNQEFTNMTGYTREDLPTGKDWFRKAYPDPQYRRKVFAAWHKVKQASSGQWMGEEFTIICKDGQARDVEFRATVLKDYVITVLKDITKRKQAENALHESEEKFRLLFDKSADPVFLLDQTRFADCNEAALTLMGCSRKEQLLGLHPYDISPKLQPDGSDSEEKARKVVAVALREGTNHFEWALRRFDGKEIMVDGTFTLIRTQGKKFLYTVWRDITDRKQAEENFRNIFENATEGIFQTSTNGALLSANPAFARLFGYGSPKEIMNSVKNVAYEMCVDAARRRELLRLLDEQGFVRNFEVQCSGKEGGITWISMNMRVVRDSERKALFYEGTATDITERKQIYEDLEGKSRSLEDANAALNVLLKHREQDRHELEEKVVNNIRELVLPYVDRLRASKSQANQAVVDIVESNLGEIMSPFVSRMASKNENFTPREIRIADLIKKGKTTKEISQALGLSVRTIDIHRFNIRRKLNLNKRKINLQSYLLSISG